MLTLKNLTNIITRIKDWFNKYYHYLLTLFNLRKKRAALTLEAENYAKTTTPKLLTFLTARKEQPELRFFALGCQGSGKQAQQQVAKLMEYIATHPNHTPDFILLLGDNFYESGMESASDSAFKKLFKEMYLTYPHLKKIPFFAILGNHDENLHANRIHGTEKGIPRGLHEVAASYRGDEWDEVSLADKIKIYSASESPLNHFFSWNMPARFYSMISGDTQLFCIDSNTYVTDYLTARDDFRNGRKENPNNQAIWLANELRKAREANRKTLLVSHHSPYSPTRRAFNEDLHLYLPKDEREQALTFFGLPLNQAYSYNKLFYTCLKEQNLKFDMVLSAHDHDIYYFNNKNDTDALHYPLCQITAGGGGGGLQKRVSFLWQKFMGCFLKQHGFVEIATKFGHPTLHAHIHTFNKNGDYQHLLFTHHDCKPKRHYPPTMSSKEKKKIETLCHTTKQAIDRYFSFLSEKQEQTQGTFIARNLDHGQDGIERAHQVWCYISQIHACDYLTTLSKIHDMTAWKSKIALPTDDSLISYLNQAFLEKYGKNIDDLYRETLQKTYKQLNQRHRTKITTDHFNNPSHPTHQHSEEIIMASPKL